MLEGEFDGCELNHIGRASNEEADALANIGLTREPVPTGVFLEQINERSIKVKPPKIPAKPAVEGEDAAKEVVEAPKAAVETEDAIEMFALEAAWTQPYLDYILRQELPDDPVEARRIVRRSKAFEVRHGELYKQATSGLLQRCISPEEGKQILRDIHEGICGHHAGS